ncbi:hypothetical protein DFJ73DRAFT_833954 [Zopfochytrium polystomum]|nr:hypothetical protein DFJ73DRAFT_833954 [Zopfochytrium polystomum]
MADYFAEHNVSGSQRPSRGGRTVGTGASVGNNRTNDEDDGTTPSSSSSSSSVLDPNLDDFMAPLPPSTSSTYGTGVSLGGVDRTEVDRASVMLLLEQLRQFGANAHRHHPGLGGATSTLDSLIAQLTSEANGEKPGKPPASKFFVANLPNAARVETACAICVEPMTSGGVPKRLTCKHQFHKECIVPWLKVHNTCPFCRREMPTDDREYEKKRKAEAKAKGYRDGDDDEDDDPLDMMFG